MTVQGQSLKDVTDEKAVLMKNVLLFTLRLSGGGAEKTVRRLAEYINGHDCGYHATVCVIFDDPDYNDEVEDLVVIGAKSKPTDNKIVRGINVVRQIRELKQIKKARNIDVCISYLPGADRINLLSDNGELKIVSVRVKESYFTHDIFRKSEITRSYRKADRIVAVSEYVRRDVIDFFGADEDKTETIHNAIESGTVQTPDTVDQRVTEFMEGHRVIINVGRLDGQKGQEHLIRAFSRVHGTYPDTVLVILGEGDLRQYLQELIDSLNCNDCILLAGSVLNPMYYMSRSDIFVLSSDVEGMPNVILEAMRAHLPCISTECGSREIMAPDTDVLACTEDIDFAEYGILIPTGNDCIMEKAILKLLEDDEMRTEYIDRSDTCLQSYAPDIIYSQWIKLLDRVVS